jgi:hypothetical protein
MPRDGAMTLFDVRQETVTIVCEACGRRGQKRFQHGQRLSRDDPVRLALRRPADAKLTDLLATLADCHKASSTNVHDRCKAVYEGL